MQLKEKLDKFHSWQQYPFLYKDKNPGEHRCANCGNQFVGNYCPICGQKDTDGPVTWKTVWKSIVHIWGIDSRSLPISLFHLVLRPGYFISDYIGGHRQTSFQPVNMLFIVTVVYAIAKHLLGLNDLATYYKSIGDNSPLRMFTIWLAENPAWAMMAMTMLLIIPTWIFFRFSPRNANLTLPQSVFIQLFISTMMIIIIFIIKITSLWMLILIPIYYCYTYRQLFGYGIWGTIWRLTLCFITWIFSVLSVAVALNDTQKDAKIFTVLFLVAILASILIIGIITNAIKGRRAKAATSLEQQQS